MLVINNDWAIFAKEPSRFLTRPHYHKQSSKIIPYSTSIDHISNNKPMVPISTPIKRKAESYDVCNRKKNFALKLSMRLMSVVMFACMLLSAAVPSAAKTHAFVVPGYDYNGKADIVTTLETGDLSWRKLNVTDGFELFFNPNSTGGLFSVENASKGYGHLGKLVELLFTPYNFKRITGVRIYVFDDRSDGIKHGTRTLTYVSGDPGYYRWTGDEREQLSLKVSSSNRNAMKFRYIEVDYDSVTGGDEPGKDDPGKDDPDEPGKDDPGKEDPDEPGKDDPNKDPDKAPVLTLSPDGTTAVAQGTVVTLTASPSTATIYYRLDGQTPRLTQDEIYRGPITLSLRGGMDLRAVAVSPNGQYCSAAARYYFSATNSIADFLANGSTEHSVKLTSLMTVVYSNGPTVYVRDNSGDIIPLELPVETEFAPGTVLSDVSATVSTDKEGFQIMRAKSLPYVASSGGASPVAAEASVGDIIKLPLHSYVAVRGVTITNGVAFSDDGRAVWLSDRFGVVPSQTATRKADIVGLVGLYSGSKCLYPTAVRLLPLEGEGEEPGEKVDSCQLSATASGGRIEIFDAINDYTLTPIGAPLTTPCRIAKGSTAYAYLLPDANKELAGAFLDGVIVEAGSPLFRTTPYGLMLEIEMDRDHQLLVAFAETDGIESVGIDGTDSAEYFTVLGISLGNKRPTKAGMYLVRIGNKVEKIIIR